MLLNQCVILVAASIKVGNIVGDQSVVVWEKPLDRKSISCWELGLSASKVERTLALGGFVRQNDNPREQLWCVTGCDDDKICMENLYKLWIENEKNHQQGEPGFIFNANEEIKVEISEYGTQKLKISQVPFKNLIPDQKKDLLFGRVIEVNKKLEGWKAITEKRRHQLYKEATPRIDIIKCVRWWTINRLNFSPECDEEKLTQFIDVGYISLIGDNRRISTTKKSLVELPMPKRITLPLSRTHTFYLDNRNRYMFIALYGKIYKFRCPIKGEAIGSFVGGGLHANLLENNIGYDQIYFFATSKSFRTAKIGMNSKIIIADDHHRT